MIKEAISWKRKKYEGKKYYVDRGEKNKKNTMTQDAIIVQRKKMEEEAMNKKESVKMKNKWKA